MTFPRDLRITITNGFQAVHYTPALAMRFRGNGINRDPMPREVQVASQPQVGSQVTMLTHISTFMCISPRPSGLYSRIQAHSIAEILRYEDMFQYLEGKKYYRSALWVRATCVARSDEVDGTLWSRVKAAAAERGSNESPRRVGRGKSHGKWIVWRGGTDTLHVHTAS